MVLRQKHNSWRKTCNFSEVVFWFFFFLFFYEQRKTEYFLCLKWLKNIVLFIYIYMPMKWSCARSQEQQHSECLGGQAWGNGWRKVQGFVQGTKFKGGKLRSISWLLIPSLYEPVWTKEVLRLSGMSLNLGSAAPELLLCVALSLLSPGCLIINNRSCGAKSPSSTWETLPKDVAHSVH